MLAVGLLALALAPLDAASAACVPRPDGQDLACVDVYNAGAATCVRTSTNPPVPETWGSSTTCLDELAHEVIQ